MPVTLKEITARYDGFCLGCRGTIIPGEPILYGGKGASGKSITYHLGCQHPADAVELASDAPLGVASREEQKATLIDCGWQAWDDRGDQEDGD